MSASFQTSFSVFCVIVLLSAYRKLHCWCITSYPFLRGPLSALPPARARYIYTRYKEVAHAHAILLRWAGARGRGDGRPPAPCMPSNTLRLNRLRSGTGRSRVTLKKWGYLNSDDITCVCGSEPQ